MNKRRANLSKSFYDLGKYSFIGLVIGRFLAKEPVNPSLFWGGLMASTVFFAIGYFVDLKGG